MTRVTTDVTHDGPVSHHWYPATDTCAAFGTIDFAPQNYLYLHTPAEIDELVAHLVALRAEMTAEPAAAQTAPASVSQ